jgi:acyl-CoA reductase-like NAD-dependent aldehyde dehydrogenase
MQSPEGVYRLFIDGEWVGSKSGASFAVVDPSTEETMAQVAEAGSAEVDLAVRAARRAFDSGPWATSTPNSRAQVLFKLAAIVRVRLAALAEVEAINTGKPIVEAEGDIDAVAEVFEYYGGLSTKTPGMVNPVSANALSLSLKEPIGVAGLIVRGTILC